MKGASPSHIPFVYRGVVVVAAVSFLLAAATGIWRIALIRGFLLPPVPDWWPPHGHLMVGGFLAGVIMFERILALRITVLAWVPYAYVLSSLFLHTGSIAARAIHMTALAGWIVHRWFAYRKFHKYEKPVVESLAYITLSSALNYPGGLVMSPVVALAALAFPVATIIVERLEMALSFRRKGAQITLWILMGWCILWNVAVWSDRISLESMGWLTLILAVGTIHSDISIRIKAKGGLQLFLRRALGVSYAWLVLSVMAMIGWNHLPGAVMKDVLFHTLGLGFIFTMILAHAPLILPAAIGKLPIAFAPVVPFVIFQILTAIRLIADLTVANHLKFWMWSGWITGTLHSMSFAVYALLVLRSCLQQQHSSR